MLQPGKIEETLVVMMKGVQESQYLKLSKCPLLDIKKYTIQVEPSLT
jgi:hypothetical protein